MFKSVVGGNLLQSLVNLTTVAHIPFLQYTVHLGPPPSCKLARSVFVEQHPHKVRMRPVATAPPLVGENGFVQLNNCLRFMSLQTLFVSDWLTASTKGYSYFKGSGLYIAKRGCLSKHPPSYYFKVGKETITIVVCVLKIGELILFFVPFIS